MKTLKEKTVSGVKWQVINKVAQKVISVATFAVLARILEPSVFGIFAMAFVAIDGLAVFQSMGLDAGLVQKRDAPEAMQHTAFFMLQAMGITMFAICFIAAPLAGKFFNNPEVGSIVRALGVVFIMSCLGKVPLSLLVKNMRFKVTAVTELVSSITNSLCAIALVMISPTVWSLVVAYIAKQIVMTSMNWWLSGYRLKFQFDPKLAKELFHFGKFLVGLNVIWFINSQIGIIVVGKMLGATLLGYFALARNMTNFVNTHFAQLISRVMFPAYSAIQDDPAALKRAYMKTVKLASIFTIPFSLVVILLAHEITLALYGEKWLPIVPLIQVMGLVQILSPMIAASGSIFQGSGNPQYSYQLGLIHLVIKVPVLIGMTLKFGVTGAAMTLLIMHAVMVPLYLTRIRRIVAFQWCEFLAQLLPSFLAAAALSTTIIVMRLLLRDVGVSASVSLDSFAHLVAYGITAVVAHVTVFQCIDRTASNEVKRLLFGAVGV
ncbi:MAG: lipopolysaccharide biosynthesis protein [Candidatus Omnitrophota bacterium]|nr:lipopolysaccharide biosynthesis protein [Candidatus Omnitrophota bacterium]